MEFSGKNQLLIYSDHVNKLYENVSAINRNTEDLLEGSTEVGLGENTDRITSQFTDC